jgi:hypothetical protein
MADENVKCKIDHSNDQNVAGKEITFVWEPELF